MRVIPSAWLEEELDPALVDFVRKDVELGVEHLGPNLWAYYNGRRGYHGKPEVFYHYLVQAGMEFVRWRGKVALFRKP